MATTADIRKGFAFTLEGKLYLVVDFQHVKPGKGGAFVRTKVRNLENNNVVELTFNSGKTLDEIRLERNPFQYLYKEHDDYIFMNIETYEQISISGGTLQGKELYLKENMEVNLLSVDQRIMDLEVPFFVDLEITETEPGIKGNTVSGGSKPAVCETGLKVTVPLFIGIGDKIKIDTQEGRPAETPPERGQPAITSKAQSMRQSRGSVRAFPVRVTWALSRMSCDERPTMSSISPGSTTRVVPDVVKASMSVGSLKRTRRFSPAARSTRPKPLSSRIGRTRLAWGSRV